jgi:hypothetical protein
MYFFDVDGTLIDNNPHNINIFVRNVSLFKYKFLYNPMNDDIRWNIITSRPKIDKLFIKLFCFKNGLVPCEIFTYNKNLLFYNIPELSGEYKLSIFKDILDGKIKPKFTKNKITKIVHICNSNLENHYININRQNYEILSINILDFTREFFDHIV